jgi:hypothetical protein
VTGLTPSPFRSGMTATNAGGCAQRREIGADGSGVDAEIAAPNRDDDRTSMRLPGQRRAYPDIVPLTVGLAPDTAFNRALDTAGRMGWTIVAADEAAARQRRLIPSQRDSIGHMMRAQLPHRTQDFRNMARQRYCRRLARIGKPCASLPTASPNQPLPDHGGNFPDRPI